MKQLWCAIFVAGIFARFILPCQAASVPLLITYEGTLKQKGTPANGLFDMQFSIVDKNGNQLASNAQLNPPPNVQVTNGLFSVQLTLPTSVDWQNVTPYIQISVGGQALTPPQAINSTMYSIVSQTVIDGSITNAKLANGSVTFDKLDPSAQVVTIPAGMIAMFATDCPSGWTRFAALDNKFPMGGSSFGATGGAATHVHTGTTSTASANYITFSGGNSANASHPNHTHSFTTNPASSLPPYLTVVYCQKQ